MVALAVHRPRQLQYVNDSLGHAAGDDVMLHSLPIALRGALRSVDTIARFGR